MGSSGCQGSLRFLPRRTEVGLQLGMTVCSDPRRCEFSTNLSAIATNKHNRRTTLEKFAGVTEGACEPNRKQCYKPCPELGMTISLLPARLLFFAPLFFYSITLSNAVAEQPRAVIELFTSQGCSSCPPADELFATMANDPEIITISLPVDYWDRLGWKDTLAKPAFTKRQVAYAGARGDGKVYTPQAVVNGTQHAVGSRRSGIDQAVAETSKNLRIPMSVERGASDIIVSLDATHDDVVARGTVVLMPVLDARQVAIGRGENANRKVIYTNIVRHIIPIGTWNGRAAVLKVPAAQFKDYDSIVVLLQAGTIAEPSTILGAARTSLH